MIRLVGPIECPCTGVDGAAAATVDTNQRVCGFVEAVIVTYTGDKPGSTDVVVATKGSTMPAQTLLTLTNKTPMAHSGCA
jgi:hypothetical protein